MKTLLRLLKSKEPASLLLLRCGLIHFLLALVILIIIPFDSRQLLGINLWIKPLKFAISIGLYCLSWSVIIQYLKNTRRKIQFAAFSVAALSFEMLAIATQAGRGELSHFNQAGMYNIILYSMMGVVITAQTIFSIYVSIPLFFNRPANLSPAMTSALRLGIAISILFALQGGLIGSRMAHTVGAADGGPGIPLLNWSKNYGDLRMAHFFGLHALQILPAWVGIMQIKKAFLVTITGLLYFSAVSYVFYQALLGNSIIP